MSGTLDRTFNLNGKIYDGNQLSQEGQQLFALLKEAQNEIVRLDIQKALLQASQQHLISQLKPILPEPVSNENKFNQEIISEASETIPTTTSAQPEEKLAPFPNHIPTTIIAKGADLT